MYLLQDVAEKRGRTVNKFRQKECEDYIKFKIAIVGLGIFGILYLVLIIAISVLIVYENKKIRFIKDELAVLQNEVKILKNKCLDDNFMTDIIRNGAETYNDLVNASSNNITHEIHNRIRYGYEVKVNKRKLGNKRHKREILNAEVDGVPILSEPYVSQKLFKTSSELLTLHGEHSINNHHKATKRTSMLSSSFNSSITSSVDDVSIMRREPIYQKSNSTRKSSVLQTNESKGFSRLRKKSVHGVATSEEKFEENRNIQEHVEAVETTICSSEQGASHRHKMHRHHHNVESMDEERANKRFNPAVHLNGDTSKYQYNHKPHYKGDGRLKHPHGYVDWTPAPWVNKLGFDRSFELRNENLTVKETGLYYIYAQIFYSDVHDKNGYWIMKNEDILAQCTVTVQSSSSIIKGNTCFTATIDYLYEDDVIKVKDIAYERISLFEIGRSFFGLVKICEIKVK